MVTTTRTWVAGTAGAAVLVVLAAWFLLIGPTRADADALAADAVATEAANEVLAASVAQLRSDFTALPERQAELAAAREALPPQLRLADLTRSLSATAEQAGVRLMSLSPATPGATDGAAEAAAATTEPSTDPAAADPAAGATATGPAVVTGPTVPTPVVVEVIGPLAFAQVFLQGLQEGVRDVLVTDLTVTAEPEAEAAGGRPATENGDVRLLVTALVFVLPDDAAGSAAPDSAAAAS